MINNELQFLTLFFFNDKMFMLKWIPTFIINIIQKQKIGKSNRKRYRYLLKHISMLPNSFCGRISWDECLNKVSAKAYFSIIFYEIHYENQWERWDLSIQTMKKWKKKLKAVIIIIKKYAHKKFTTYSYGQQMKQQST